MKTIVIREFTRDFAAHRNEPCQVKDRGRVVGTWIPVSEQPPEVDFAARRKKNLQTAASLHGRAIAQRVE